MEQSEEERSKRGAQKSHRPDCVNLAGLCKDFGFK